MASMLNRFMEWLVDGVRLRLIGPTLLQDIEFLQLGATIDDTTRLGRLREMNLTLRTIGIGVGTRGSYAR